MKKTGKRSHSGVPGGGRRSDNTKDSGEVESVQWFPLTEAIGKIREGSITWQLVRSVCW